jgi:hypothetical protein
MKESLNSLNKEFKNQSEFESKKKALNFHISALLNVDTAKTLFTDTDSIHFKMNNKLNKLKSDIFEINVLLKHLGADKDLLEENGFIVHPELKMVKDQLYKKGFDSILGVEYLLNTTISKEEKVKMVDANPMLVFSLVFENNEFTKLKRTLEKMKFKLSIPVVLIAKEALNSREEKGSIISLENNSYIFSQFDNRLTKEDWESYREELNNRISEQIALKEQHLTDSERHETLKEQIKSFFATYDENSEKLISDTIDQLQQRINDVEDLIEEEKAMIIQLDNDIIESEKQRSILEDKLERYNEFQKID